jgi:hypothetical protein
MRVRVWARVLAKLAIGTPALWVVGCLMVTVAHHRALADQRSPNVVIDSWWSADYAQKSCEQVKTLINDETESRIRNFGCGAVPECPEAMARVAACASGVAPKAQAHAFEDRLMTQFTTSPDCKGAAFARDYGPDAQPPSAAEEIVMNKPHWQLSIDFAAGSPTQSWSLQYLGDDKVLQRQSATEAKLASDVCAIVLGRSTKAAR